MDGARIAEGSWHCLLLRRNKTLALLDDIVSAVISVAQCPFVAPT
jgi:hypothetical protein